MIKLTFSNRNYCPFCAKTVIDLKFHLLNVLNKKKPCSKLTKNIRKINKFKNQCYVFFQIMQLVYNDTIDISFDSFMINFSQFFNKTIASEKEIKKACEVIIQIAENTNGVNNNINEEYNSTSENDDDNKIYNLDILNEKIKIIEKKIKMYDKMKNKIKNIILTSK